MPETAGPGVETFAEALADASCELRDAASTAGSWSATAAEDAIEAMETTALALGTHPLATATVAAVGELLAQLRQELGLPLRRVDDLIEDQGGKGQDVAPTTPRRRRRPLGGLGPHGRQVRIPATRNASGR
ncbi:hypothetical protein GCM10010329_82860 [Streptomyces spiroverticillatus]|uniref:Uncharacterized protein n=1 Tax=Streptomyces finlayi TaxID=67296 RepID=A0A919CFV3_9ACTN|nr:hypothetical protein GCM10010329_82860 [Streptomyces spiroverticillatus]GHD18786.1 hypothetical protein GCM10010334_81930 [Streptomyces finlayi]